MDKYIIPAVLGAVIIAFGIMNIHGNISMLHRYHRKRVTEEDRIPFGKTVGIGTIIAGASLLLRTCFSLAADTMNSPQLESAGTIVFTVVFVIGLAIMVFAMIKYNKGVF